MLAEYHADRLRAEQLAEEIRQRREEIFRAMESNATVEPGQYTVYRAVYTCQRVTWGTLDRVLSSAEIQRLRRVVPRTSTKSLYVRRVAAPLRDQAQADDLIDDVDVTDEFDFDPTF